MTNKELEKASSSESVQNGSSSRIQYLDVLRILACFLVAFTHSQMPNIEENGLWLSCMSFASSPSSELFLTLSGAILLPVHVPFRIFYKRRFLKLLPPMFIWSIVGIALHLVTDKVSLSDAMLSFLYIPFKPVIGVYWFLYVMIGLYMIAPFISFWLRDASKRQIEFFLAIWLLNCCLPWYNLVDEGFYNENGSHYWMFNNFGGFLGYWILGFYLRHFTPKIKSRFGVVAIVVSAIYALALVSLKLVGKDYTVYMGNLQVGSISMVCTIFIVVSNFVQSSKFSTSVGNICTHIAQYSFGIYLMHTYVIREGLWRFVENHRLWSHPIIETSLIALAGITICIVIMKCFSFNRWLSRVIFGVVIPKH